MSVTTNTRWFEYSEGNSNKFWECVVTGTEVIVRWGRIGTQGQSQTKSFATTAKAEKHAESLIAQKLKKGYTEVK